MRRAFTYCAEYCEEEAMYEDNGIDGKQNQL
jgi:hypothetical protein